MADLFGGTLPTDPAMPFRPSNGCMGEAFQADYCDVCKRLNDPCDILFRTLCHDIGDPEYPAEWLHNSRTAWCSAFEEDGG